MSTLPDWFNGYARDHFATHLAHLAGQPNLAFLQIGAYTGDATTWLLNNILTSPGSTLVDVDTWEGSDEPEHHAMDFAQVEATYDDRTGAHQKSGQLRKIRRPSSAFLRDWAGPPFDFIYIDGDHAAPAVLADAVGAWTHLRPGGLLAFDDYHWHSGQGPTHDPQLAIDAFTSVYADHLTIITTGLQAWAQRNQEPSA